MQHNAALRSPASNERPSELTQNPHTSPEGYSSRCRVRAVSNAAKQTVQRNNRWQKEMRDLDIAVWRCDSIDEESGAVVPDKLKKACCCAKELVSLSRSKKWFSTQHCCRFLLRVWFTMQAPQHMCQSERCVCDCQAVDMHHIQSCDLFPRCGQNILSHLGHSLTTNAKPGVRTQSGGTRHFPEGNCLQH